MYRKIIKISLSIAMVLQVLLVPQVVSASEAEYERLYDNQAEVGFDAFEMDDEASIDDIIHWTQAEINKWDEYLGENEEARNNVTELFTEEIDEAEYFQHDYIELVSDFDALRDDGIFEVVTFDEAVEMLRGNTEAFEHLMERMGAFLNLDDEQEVDISADEEVEDEMMPGDTNEVIVEGDEAEDVLALSGGWHTITLGPETSSWSHTGSFGTSARPGDRVVMMFRSTGNRGNLRETIPVPSGMTVRWSSNVPGLIINSGWQDANFDGSNNPNWANFIMPNRAVTITATLVPINAGGGTGTSTTPRPPASSTNPRPPATTPSLPATRFNMPRTNMTADGVVRNNTRLRRGPSTRYHASPVLPRTGNPRVNRGASITIRYRTASWSYVEASNGRRGWLPNSQIRRVNTTGIILRARTRLHSSPNVNARTLTRLNRNSTVVVLAVGAGNRHGWAQVQAGGRTGWVQWGRTRDAYTFTQTRRTRRSIVMRRGPGTRFARMRTIRNGRNVEVIGRNGNWIQVRYRNRTGWVQRSRTRSHTQTRRLRHNWTTMRRGATIEANRNSRSTLRGQSRVRVLGQSSMFTRVRIGNRTGWVFTSHLR